MEITTTTTTNPGRRAAVNAFAIVGFIALILIGIWLAVYTSRHSSKISSKFNGAAVSLSSFFHKKEDTLEVVSTTTTTTLPFEVATTTIATSSAATVTPIGVTHVPTSGGSYPVIVNPVPAPLYGNPDLAVSVTDIGYTAQNGVTGSFRGSNDIPFGQNGAVKFTVTNVGTNASGAWNFSVDIPTSPSQHFTAPLQPSLNPGDSVDFILGFDRGYSNGQKTVTVTVDPDNRLLENTKINNVSTRWVIVD